MVIYNITYNRSSTSVATIDEYQDEFYEAAANGHTQRVLRLIAKAGVKLDKPDLNGMTALHHACLSGFRDTMEAILKAGARIDSESPVYGTPLCLAVLKEREDLVDELHNILKTLPTEKPPGSQDIYGMDTSISWGSQDLEWHNGGPAGTTGGISTVQATDEEKVKFKRAVEIVKELATK